MDWTGFAANAAVLLIPVVAVLVALLLGAGFSYLRTKSRWIAESKAVGALESSIKATVARMSQEVVDDLKAANADGKLTTEEMDQVRSDAIDAVLNQMTLEQQAIMGSVTSDLEGWITAKLEEAVRAQHPTAVTVGSLANPPSPSPGGVVPSSGDQLPTVG